MKVINLHQDNFLSDIKQPIDNLVIGFFDGLHKGHKQLFENLEGNVSVLTLSDLVFKKPYLYNLEERLFQLEICFHPDNIFLYDLRLENLSAEAFITKFLDVIKPKQIIVGSDFKFGNNHKDVIFLSQFYQLKIIPRDTRYSSTEVKKLIKTSQFEQANKILLFPYYRSGLVEHGFKISRTLNFRTANLKIDDDLVTLDDGIYITKTTLQNQSYYSSTFIGIPKTFQAIDKKQFETYLINCNKTDFYNEKLVIYFYKYLDKVRKYDSVDLLIKGIKKQIELTLDFFKEKEK